VPLNNEITLVWEKVRQSEETTFNVHSEKAGKLYNEASTAVDSLPPKDASSVLKASQADLRTLWLRSDERDRYHEWFDNLWSKLRAKREEKKTEWRERQEHGLSKLVEARDKVFEALRRVRNNIGRRAVVGVL
jgi:hypothetical protein